MAFRILRLVDGGDTGYSGDYPQVGTFNGQPDYFNEVLDKRVSVLTAEPASTPATTANYSITDGARTTVYYQSDSNTDPVAGTYHGDSIGWVGVDPPPTIALVTPDTASTEDIFRFQSWLETKIADLQTKVDSYDAPISGLPAAISTLGGQATSLGTSASTINSAAGSITTALSGLPASTATAVRTNLYDTGSGSNKMHITSSGNVSSLVAEYATLMSPNEKLMDDPDAKIETDGAGHAVMRPSPTATIAGVKWVNMIANQYAALSGPVSFIYSGSTKTFNYHIGATLKFTRTQTVNTSGVPVSGTTETLSYSNQI